MAKQHRNQFNLTEGNGLSARMGRLIPYYVRHLYPGDTINIQSFISSRFMPMQAPLMSQIEIKTWGFFVPYRLIWDDYKQFFTGKDKNGNPVDTVFPRAEYSGVSVDSSSGSDREAVIQATKIGGLGDYLDLNVNMGETPTQVQYYNDNIERLPSHSMLEPRGYACIFNNYFRDQNIDPAIEYGTDSFIYDFGSVRAIQEYSALMTLRSKRWAKDVYTSALPTPSMSDDVEIPINAEVVFNPDSLAPADQMKIVTPSGVEASAGSTSIVSGGYLRGSGNGTNNLSIDPNGTLDVLNSGATIRELTKSKMLYQYLLDVARNGSVHYKDWVKEQFGVRTSDARLEIPEFIGGGSQDVIVSDVVQTSETNITAQGNLSGRAVSPSNRDHYFNYKATEHGFVMLILCIMPRPFYGSGMPKRHFKFDKFDYFTKQFDHIGDEEIKNLELTSDPTFSSAFSRAFGYAPRYYDDKSSVNRVHGKLRTDLKYWTMARFINNIPALNSGFLIPDDALLDRPFFVQSTVDPDDVETEHAILEINNVVDAYRPMSKNSKPFV